MENLKIEIGGVNLSDLANRMERIEKHLNDLNTTPPEQEEVLLSRNETIELLGITSPTLHAWKKKTLLKSYRIGSRLRYKKSEVMEALKDTAK